MYNQGNVFVLQLTSDVTTAKLIGKSTMTVSIWKHPWLPSNLLTAVSLPEGVITVAGNALQKNLVVCGKSLFWTS